MRIAYITSGAVGMYCGSCMHDNTLAKALRGLGHDALLIPTYTPIRTDEEDVSQRRVFFGGINVYLQQRLGFFRHTPWFFDRLLDSPRLLRWVSRFAAKTQAEDLGDLTVSMLRGYAGNQGKEITKLARFLAEEIRPDVVLLSNVLISGMAEELKRRVGVPVLGCLQGDDLFLDGLPARFREVAMGLLRANCRYLQGFIATSGYYADHMAELLRVDRGAIHVVLPGLNLRGYARRAERPGDRPLTIGYFARICPEKGLHLLVDAFVRLRQSLGCPDYQLRASGWLGESSHSYLEEQKVKLRQAGLESSFQYIDSPDHDSKSQFFHLIDLLAVPTTYREPKGLYVLEALAHGVPVVQPRHGSFPELLEATGGGWLHNPHDPEDLAICLGQVLSNQAERVRHAESGYQAVHRHFTDERMARETLAVFAHYLS